MVAVAFQFLCVAKTIIANAMKIMLMIRMSIVNIFPTSVIAKPLNSHGDSRLFLAFDQTTEPLPRTERKTAGCEEN